MTTLLGLIDNSQTLSQSYYGAKSAKDYDRNFKNFDDDLLFIRDLVGSLSVDISDILILGAGTGDWAIELAKLGHRVTALDISEHMLSVLKDKIDRSGSSIDMLIGNMAEFKSSKKYDFILIPNCALMHLDSSSLKDTFSLCFQNLKRGGHIYADHVVNLVTHELPVLKYVESQPDQKCAYEMSLADVQHTDDSVVKINLVRLSLNKDGTYSCRYANSTQRIYTTFQLSEALKQGGFQNFTFSPHHMFNDGFIDLSKPTISILASKG